MIGITEKEMNESLEPRFWSESPTDILLIPISIDL